MQPKTSPHTYLSPFIKCPDLLTPLIDFYIDQGFGTIAKQIKTFRMGAWYIVANGHGRQKRFNHASFSMPIMLKPFSFTVFYEGEYAGTIQVHAGEWNANLPYSPDDFKNILKGSHDVVTTPA